MDATRRTIVFLRQLTRDGFLSGEEIWSLAKFFNAHPECGAVWPGSVLSPMLESAFDDATLTEEEMTLLAETISSIEEEWRLKNPPTPAELAADVPLSVQPAVIPAIDAKFEIEAHNEDGSYIVALKDHTCTCSECQDRRALPPGHPGKCCKHVAHAFTRTGKVFKPWFQALLDDCFAHGRGTNPAFEWFLVELPSKAALIGTGYGAWCNVYAPSPEGYDSFAFNREQRLWSYGAYPDQASLIERAIQDKTASTRL